MTVNDFGSLSGVVVVDSSSVPDDGRPGYQTFLSMRTFVSLE